MKTLTFYGIQNKNTGILVCIWSGVYHSEDGHFLTEDTDNPIWMVREKQDALNVLNGVENTWKGRHYEIPDIEFKISPEEYEVVEIKVNW